MAVLALLLLSLGHGSFMLAAAAGVDMEPPPMYHEVVMAAQAAAVLERRGLAMAGLQYHQLAALLMEVMQLLVARAAQVVLTRVAVEVQEQVLVLWALRQGEQVALVLSSFVILLHNLHPIPQQEALR
jgi:hypothetical protein